MIGTASSIINNQMNRTAEMIEENASNFPVDRLCGSFSNIYNGFDLASRHLSVLEREALFFKTAASVYNVEI
jgi:hypothetical protein